SILRYRPPPTPRRGEIYRARRAHPPRAPLHQRRHKWQRKIEGCATTNTRRIDPDLTAVRFNQSPCCCQAKPTSVWSSIYRQIIIDPIKTIKNAIKVLRGNTDTLISDTDTKLDIIRLNHYLNTLALWRVRHR